MEKEEIQMKLQDIKKKYDELESIKNRLERDLEAVKTNLTKLVGQYELLQEMLNDDKEENKKK